MAKTLLMRILKFAAFTAAVALYLLASDGARAQQAGVKAARTADGKPNLSGIWQARTTANWNLEPHGVEAGPSQYGALFSVPASQGVVDGGTIPYKPEALAKRNENARRRWTEDPEAKCYRPGVPRFVYMPYPLQIVQSPTAMLMISEYKGIVRDINMAAPVEAGVDTWMGQSNGRWEGDTLVIDVTGLNGDAWLDRAGNFASDSAHIIERYVLKSDDRDHLLYEATIEDVNVFTRPWRIQLPLYRVVESNAQLMEFNCIDLSEELLYGQFRKK